MKTVLVLFLFLGAISANAANSSSPSMGMMSNQSKMTAAMRSEQETPQWKFQVGQSRVVTTYGDSESAGNGLTLGGTYNFNEMFAVGGSFTEFKMDRGLYNQNTDNLDLVAAYGEFTPLHYQFPGADLAASLLAGLITGNYQGGNTSTMLFYGAGITVSWNNQIGVGIDTKVTRDFKSMNQISLIGYY